MSGEPYLVQIVRLRVPAMMLPTEFVHFKLNFISSSHSTWRMVNGGELPESQKRLQIKRICKLNPIQRGSKIEKWAGFSVEFGRVRGPNSRALYAMHGLMPSENKREGGSPSSVPTRRCCTKITWTIWPWNWSRLNPRMMPRSVNMQRHWNIKWTT